MRLGVGSVSEPKGLVFGSFKVWVHEGLGVGFTSGRKGLGSRVRWGPNGGGWWVHVWIQGGWVSVRTQSCWGLSPWPDPRALGMGPCSNLKEYRSGLCLDLRGLKAQFVS